MRWRVRTTIFAFAAVWFGAQAPGTTAGASSGTDENDLRNPGFETTAAGAAGPVAAWRPYGRGFEMDGAVQHRGKRSIRCSCRGPADVTGAVQVIRYPHPDKRPIFVGGWSRAKGVGAGGDYSIYLDIIYADGTPWWGRQCPFSRGDHDWEYQGRMFHPRKPVREIQVFLLLRRTSGTAWFDDIVVARGGLHFADTLVAWDFPRSRNGLRIEAALTSDASWTCEVRSAPGGGIEARTGNGRTLSLTAALPDGARPAAVCLSARTGAGEHAELVLPVPPRMRRCNPVRKGFAVWTRSGMNRIYPADMPSAPSRYAEAEIHLARNEHEGFQIAVTPADSLDLRSVTLQIGEFRDAAGRVLPSGAVRWRRIGYVWVDTPSGHPDAPHFPAWHPDVLLPPRPFAVPGGTTRTVWVDVAASPECRPGTYRGRILIKPAGRAPGVVDLRIRVWRFALPVRPAMKTAFCLMDGFVRDLYGVITPRLRKQCLDIMLDHRLNPDDISRTRPPRLQDLLYARKRGMNAFNILNLVPEPGGNPLWVCYAPKSAYGPEFTDELRRRLDPVVRELRAHGLARMAYVYGFDERGPDYDAIIRRTFGFVKRRYPEVHTMTTAGYLYERQKQMRANAPEDHVDWYCPLTPRYDPVISDRLRTRGKEVWWYVCCGPRHPYANFAAIDYPAIEGRLLGWMTFGFKSDGLLYWHVNYWHGNAVIPDDAPACIDWKPPCVAGMCGDGVLVYPTASGPVPSIRLENIRDGVEDYDYLWMLARRRGRAAAMSIYRQMVTDLTSFSRDPARLYHLRDRMAGLIETAERKDGNE